MALSSIPAPDSPPRRCAEEVALNFMEAILAGEGARGNWKQGLRRTSDHDGLDEGNACRTAG
jgi:hypothetical protein